jgi:EPTP domain
MESTVTLTEVQRIPTSGARAVAPFTVDGAQFLAIPQLALDIAGQEPNMNGGDSDTELLLLKRTDGQFVPWATLPAPGGEDAEFFTINDRVFLAVASIRSGSGPYELTTESLIFTWQDNRFVPFQAITTFAAKQWKHWQVDGRHFLGLAQGVRLPGTEDQNRDSVVYEWDGEAFVEQQRIPSQWAYNWHPFRIGSTMFVAHAEHLGASVLYRWDGEQLLSHQTLAAHAGRAFASFDRDGASYLVVASLAEPPRLMRWDGDRFKDVQILADLGARELAVIAWRGRLFVVRINFILGTPADPKPVLNSQIYEWDGGALRVVKEFPTCGGTDVAVIECDDEIQLAVSNSLSPSLRFANDTVLYSLSIKAA